MTKAEIKQEICLPVRDLDGIDPVEIAAYMADEAKNPEDPMYQDTQASFNDEISAIKNDPNLSDDEKSRQIAELEEAKTPALAGVESWQTKVANRCGICALRTACDVTTDLDETIAAGEDAMTIVQTSKERRETHEVVSSLKSHFETWAANNNRLKSVGASILPAAQRKEMAKRCSDAQARFMQGLLPIKDPAQRDKFMHSVYKMLDPEMKDTFVNGGFKDGVVCELSVYEACYTLEQDGYEVRLSNSEEDVENGYDIAIRDPKHGIEILIDAKASMSKDAKPRERYAPYVGEKENTQGQTVYVLVPSPRTKSYPDYIASENLHGKKVFKFDPPDHPASFPSLSDIIKRSVEDITTETIQHRMIAQKHLRQ